MTIRLVYQIQKWLAVIVAVATLCWVLHGALMSAPGGTFRLTSVDTDLATAAHLPGAPEFDADLILSAQAITAVEARVGQRQRVDAIVLRTLPGRLVFEVSARAARVQLVKALSSDIGEILAQRLVERFFGAHAGRGEAKLVTQPLLSYMGMVPAFRLPPSDGNGSGLMIRGLLVFAGVLIPCRRFERLEALLGKKVGNNG